MKSKISLVVSLLTLAGSLSLQAQSKTTTPTPTPFKIMSLPKTEDEWKKKLTPEEYNVLRKKGTERPYVGEYDQFWEPGVYVCKGCGAELFSSTTKFDAGCGWPSFYQGIDKSKIIEEVDSSFGMRRIEATFLMTVPRPRVCDIALIPSHSDSRKRNNIFVPWWQGMQSISKLS